MKKRLKHAFLWFARLLGFFYLARLLTRRGFLVIGWHGVSMADEHERIPEYFITPQTLRQRLAYLKKHFEIVSLDEAVRQHAEGKIRPRQVVLTFDDGMYDFAAAVPVLKEFDSPATVYVVSSTMNRPTQADTMVILDLFYLTKLSEAPTSVCGLNGHRSLATPAARDECAGLCRQAYWELPPDADRRNAFVKELASQLQVDFEDLWRRRVWHYMSADEVRQLSQDGVDIEVHSHSHQSVVDYAESVFQDTDTCRALIEETTGKPARDYCYPSGYWEHRSWQPLHDAGMRSAVTCNLGPNFAGTPPLALRRYIDNEGLTQLEFEFAASGLRWLMHVVLHPARLYEPSETRADPAPLF